MRSIGLILLIFLLAGCNSDSDTDQSIGPTVGATAIKCADLYNDDAGNSCIKQTASLADRIIGLFLPKSAQAAITPKVYDAGTLSRYKDNGDLNLITAYIEVENSTTDVFVGYFEYVFNAGCNGSDTWTLAPKQPMQPVNPGETVPLSAGGMCSDMPLGAHTLTATVYGPDSQEIVDQAIVTFTLVE